MSEFSEQLAAAKAAPARTRDVTITLDHEVSSKREALEAELIELQRAGGGDQRLGAQSPTARIEAAIAELLQQSLHTLVTLRFSRLPGTEWRDITSRCPVRLDAPADMRYGYNIQKAVELAAPLCGARVEGEALVPLRVQPGTEDTPAVNEWRDLFKVISGYEFGQIEEAIYRLNEWEPAALIGDLVKASGARQN